MFELCSPSAVFGNVNVGPVLTDHGYFIPETKGLKKKIMFKYLDIILNL